MRLNSDQIIKDIDNIAAIDADVRNVLPVYGYPAPRIRPAGFETFLSTIVGQQISTEAAKAIMNRPACAGAGYEGGFGDETVI